MSAVRQLQTQVPPQAATEAGHAEVGEQSSGARWIVVDSFEERGNRYIVVRLDRVPGEDLAKLTNRERQIVIRAAHGLTNKEIAFALGISDTTVRVLMARAARRVGVRTRRALLAHLALVPVRPSQTDGL